MTEKDFERRLQKINEEKALMMRLHHSGLSKLVRFVSGKALHMETGEIEARRAAMVREFGPDKLLRYYLNDRELAVGYSHEGDYEMVYYDENAEERLRQISGGRCIITREAVESIAEQIICAREEA